MINNSFLLGFGFGIGAIIIFFTIVFIYIKLVEQDKEYLKEDNGKNE